MSRPLITTPANPVSLQQALNDVIESVALEETALSHILNAEGEKIQRVVADDDATIAQLLLVNESVDSVVRSIVKLQLLLNCKLEAATEAIED